MITIIDYGVGNVRALLNVYERLKMEVKIARTAQDVENASKIILPGVGSFDYAMSQFNQSGMRDTVENLIFNKEVPILGICVGMQMMASSSDEGQLPGLRWIDGEVKLFDADLIKHKTQLPHMGWNTIRKNKENKLMKEIDNEAIFYFLHSYYFHCNDKNNILCETEYGINYASAVNKDNIWGVQFHPEKSHSNGVQLLLNFATL